MDNIYEIKVRTIKEDILSFYNYQDKQKFVKQKITKIKILITDRAKVFIIKIEFKYYTL